MNTTQPKTDEYTTPRRLIDAIDAGQAVIEIDADDDLYDVVVEDMRKGGFRTEEHAHHWMQSLRAGLDTMDRDVQIPHNQTGTDMIYDAVSIDRNGAEGWF